MTRAVRRCTLSFLPVALATLALSPVRVPAQRPAAQPHSSSSRTLRAFTSDEELTQWLATRAKAYELHLTAHQRELELRARIFAEQRRLADAACEARRPDTTITRARRANAHETSPAIITGRVLTEFGQPLEGANAYIAELAISVGTSAAGCYVMTIPAQRLPQQLVLRVRSFGFVPRSIPVAVAAGDSIAAGFALRQDVNRLSEVVVTGVAPGTAQRNLPFTVAKVDEREMPVPAAGTLQGRTPGAYITNTQHEAIDEGDIVKVHGRHLVVLRRGRLFTVEIGDRELRRVATVDASAPGMNASAWYDEMLVQGDRVVVIGYNYRFGTEIGVFAIDAMGALQHRETFHLGSDDYYSARNYASRIVGSRLLLYAPRRVPPTLREPSAMMPTIRRWKRAGEGMPVSIGRADRIYRVESDSITGDWLTMHTVTTCDLAAAEVRCEATGVLGSNGHTFYVSPTAVYVHASAGRATGAAPSAARLFRLPFAGAPTGLRIAGSPVDQFSFLERDSVLHLVVRRNASGAAMWASESTEGAVALARIPIGAFGNGAGELPTAAYQHLPEPKGTLFQNRFVGGHLLYAAAARRPGAKDSDDDAFVVALATGVVTPLRLEHAVERIEGLGRDAVLVGRAGADLHFTGVALGQQPAPRQRYVMRNASQGETRSHGFFYRPDAADAGVLGLPIRPADESRYASLTAGSASVLFLRNAAQQFIELGSLASQARGTPADGCKTSCVDWYGNARPIFLGDRVFALLGYELVEGAIRGGTIREVRRVDFMPRPELAAR